MSRRKSQNCYRSSRSCLRTEQLNSSTSTLARHSNLSLTYQPEASLHHSNRFHLLSPISASTRLPILTPRSPGSATKSPSSAGLRGPVARLEKGFGLVKKLYGPVPVLPGKQTEKIERVVLLRRSEATNSKVDIKAPTATFLNLQDFEKLSKVAKRRGSHMSLTNLPGVIKLKLTPASPISCPRRKRTNSEVLSTFSPSPKARSGPQGLFALTNATME